MVEDQDIEGIYCYEVDYGRRGTVSGTFVATRGKVESLRDLTVYFGEILGKHSDVSVDFSEEELICLTEDQAFIKKAKEYKLVPIGRNPFDYIDEDESDDDYEEDDEDY